MDKNLRKISIGMYNPLNDTWAVGAIFINNNLIPTLTYLDIAGLQVRLKLMKLSKTKKPLYEVKVIKL